MTEFLVIFMVIIIIAGIIIAIKEIKKTDDKKALEVISNTTSASKLIGIIKNSNDENIVKTAAEKMRNLHSEELLKIFIEEVTERAIIAEMFSEEDLSNDKYFALLKRKKDMKIELETAGKIDNSILETNLYHVIPYLPDETFISKIAKNESNNSTVRLKAALALNDKAVLTKIAKDTNNDSSIRLEAALFLNDRAVLTEIAKDTNNDSSIRLEAALVLNDEVVLAEIQKCILYDIVVESVSQLVHLYGLSPRREGFLVGSYAAEPVRKIGEKLNDKGGFQLMLEVHGRFAASYQVFGAARNLEMVWDGIGEWRG